MEERIVIIDEQELQLLSVFHPEFCKAYRQIGYAVISILERMEAFVSRHHVMEG